MSMPSYVVERLCRRAGCIVLAGLLCVLWSCASPTHRLSATNGAQEPPPDEAFEAGANRPPTVETLFAMARLFEQRGSDAECESVLRRIIGQHRGFMPAYCKLAELQMRQQRIDSAIRLLNAGLEVRPTDPLLLNNLGVCWLVKRDYEQALAAFSRAAAALPDNARYRANMAVALAMMGRYEPSLALFEQVLPPADAHFNLAVLCDARNDTAQATREYEEAARLSSAQKRK